MQIDTLSLDDPHRIQDDVVRVLGQLGTAADIPRVLVDVCSAYFTKHIDEAGTPVFSGGSYFTPETPGAALSGSQQSLGIVDSFAKSVTLSLPTIGFAKVFRHSVIREDVRQRTEQLESM